MVSPNDTDKGEPPFALPLVAGAGREIGEIFEGGEVTALCIVDPNRDMGDEDVDRIAKEIVHRANHFESLFGMVERLTALLRTMDSDAVDDSEHGAALRDADALLKTAGGKR
jgi:hypothetical protein